MSIRSFVHYAWIAARGSFLSQCLAAILIPITARLYERQDVGRAGLVVSFLVFAGIFASWRLEIGIPTVIQARNAQILAFACGALSVVMSLLAMGTMTVFIATGSLGFASIPWFVVPIVGISMLLTAWGQVWRYVVIRIRRPDDMASMQIVQAAVRAAVLVPAGFAGWGLAALVVADSAGRFGSLMAVARQARSWLGSTGRIGIQEIRNAIKDQMHPSLMATLSGAINTAGTIMPAVMVAARFGPTATGLYVVAQQVVSVPTGMVAAAVNDAFFSRLGSLSRAGEPFPGLFAALVWCAVLVIGLVGWMVLDLAGDRLFIVVLGPNWGGCGVIARAVAPWFILQMTAAAIGSVAYARGWQGRQIALDLLACVTVGYCFAVPDDLEGCTSRAGIAMALVYVLYGIFFLSACRWQPGARNG